jgi:hypothetical protein
MASKGPVTMPEGRRLLLHIGYHKTGSSWLQRELFRMPRAWDEAPHPDNALTSGFFAPCSRKEISSHLVWDQPLRFDATLARDFFADRVDHAFGRSLIPVVSHERLSGLPQIGGWDSKEIADRLAEVFPSARVLIVVREQASMLLSLWKGYVKRGGKRSAERFVAAQLSPGPMGPLAQHLEYHRLIHHYHRLFGRENVLVLPFELLSRQPIMVLAKICEFAEATVPRTVDHTPENPSLSRIGLATQRLLNIIAGADDIDLLPSPRPTRAVAASILKADRRLPSRFTATPDRRAHAAVRTTLGARYAESNRLTSQLTDTDLSRFGYSC